MGCSASVAFEERLVREGVLKGVSASSPYAAEGTAAHFLLNRCLRDMLGDSWHISAEKYAGSKIDVELAGDGCKMAPRNAPPATAGWLQFEADDDMIWAVDVAVKYVRGVLESMGGSAEGGLPHDVRVDLEVSGDLSFLGVPDAGGTVDVRITQFLGRMEVIDYKHGRGVAVYPEENTQLLIYAGCDDAGYEEGVTDVRLTIVQPRCSENETIASWDRPAEWVRAWLRNELVPAARRVDLGEDGPFAPGAKQCQWCPCLSAPFGHHCAAAAEAALLCATADFDVPPVGEESTYVPSGDDEKRAVAKVKAMGPDRLAILYGWSSFIDTVMKAAAGCIEGLLMAGVPVPDYKLVAGRSTRKWADGAEDGLKKARVPQKVSHELKLLSFTVIEKVDGGKYKDVVKRLTVKPDGRPTIAPLSDKRPAIPPPAVTDFPDEAPQAPDEMFS
jgi:hypothetical protein